MDGSKHLCSLNIKIFLFAFALQLYWAYPMVSFWHYLSAVKDSRSLTPKFMTGILKTLKKEFRHTQTHRQTDTQADRHTDRQTQNKRRGKRKGKVKGNLQPKAREREMEPTTYTSEGVKEKKPFLIYGLLFGIDTRM